MNKTKILLALILVLGACAPNHKNLYLQDKDFAAREGIETRFLEIKEEEAVLAAAAQALRDIRFTVDDTQQQLGILTGVRSFDNISRSPIIAIYLISKITGSKPRYKEDQNYYANIVTKKLDSGIKLRIVFAARMFDNYGEIMQTQKIWDEEFYKEFFAKLDALLPTAGTTAALATAAAAALATAISQPTPTDAAGK